MGIYNSHHSFSRGLAQNLSGLSPVENSVEDSDVKCQGKNKNNNNNKKKTQKKFKRQVLPYRYPIDVGP